MRQLNDIIIWIIHTWMASSNFSAAGCILILTRPLCAIFLKENLSPPISTDHGVSILQLLIILYRR